MAFLQAGLPPGTRRRRRRRRHSAGDTSRPLLLPSRHLSPPILPSPLLLQEFLLGLDWFRGLVLYAFRGRHRATLEAALKAPPARPRTFADLDYWVDPSARQVLQFAALHALSSHLQAEEVLAPAQLLPPVSRVLLQTEEARAGKYLEAVAAALASQIGAGLLLVDAMLLATIASATFGRPPETYLSQFGGGGSSSGGGGGRAAEKAAAARLALAWRALRDALHARQRPTVVFVRDAEQLLCSSYETHKAFWDSWCSGSSAELALEGGGGASRAPLVLLGGLSVDESAAALAGVRPQRQQQAGGAGGGVEEGGDDFEGWRPKSGK